MCAYATIIKYIELTSKLRKTSKLWIRFVRPHQEVGRQTINRWLKTTLTMSGIDKTIFTFFSTRMASSSKIAAMGIGLQTIVKTPLFVCLFGFLTSSSTTRLYCGRAPRQSVWQFYVLPHMRQTWETMTSVSAGHIILTPTQPVGCLVRVHLQVAQKN